MLREVIYKGATRPAMKFGVPLVPLVTVFGAGMLIIMWGGAFFTWWTALAVPMALVPILVLMRWITKKDDQRFRQMFLSVKLRMTNRNRCLWRSRSYAPYVYRGARHAWRR